MNQIETLGSQVFSVPNTEEGRLFVSLCHKYLNTLRYRIMKRGRAKDRKRGYLEMVAAGARDSVPNAYTLQSDAPPMPYCDWTAVYFPKHSNYVIKNRIENIKNKRK